MAAGEPPRDKTPEQGDNVDKLPRQSAAQWLAENRKAIEHYNERIAREGVFGEEYRCF